MHVSDKQLHGHMFVSKTEPCMNICLSQNERHKLVSKTKPCMSLSLSQRHMLVSKRKPWRICECKSKAMKYPCCMGVPGVATRGLRHSVSAPPSTTSQSKTGGHAAGGVVRVTGTHVRASVAANFTVHGPGFESPHSR